MVFVLSKNKKPLMPCHPARARELLRKGKATIHKIHPFTIRLKNRTDGTLQPVRIKFDPGAKTTGMALVSGHKVLSFAEINHRTGIKDKIIKKKDTGAEEGVLTRGIENRDLIIGKDRKDGCRHLCNQE